MNFLKQYLAPNRAAYPGVFVGTAALFMPFVGLKENRVVDGRLFRLWEILPPPAVVLLVLLLLGSLASPKRGRRDFWLWLTGAALLVLVSTALALASPVLGLERFPYGRISPAAGFWLLLAAAYLLMSFHRKRYQALPWLFLVLLFAAGRLEGLGFVREFRNEESRFFLELGRHMLLALGAVGAAILLGVPAGILAWKKKAYSSGVFAFVNSVQTIPSLALFGLLIAPLAFLSRNVPLLRELGLRGVGRTPALIALALYALLPIVRNTFTSLSVIDRGILDAGRGMGMTPAQLFFRVELPIAIPIILSGIRISLVQTAGNTTVAALIGAGGLGYFVFRGLEQAAPDLIVMGVIPIILLVILLDKLFGILIGILTPDGLEALYDSP